MKTHLLISHLFTLTVALFATIFIAQTQSVPFAGYGPAGIGDKDSTNGEPKMVLWLSADTGVVTNQDNEVTKWYDISGWGDSATNEYAGDRPPNYTHDMPQGPEYRENGFGGLPTICFGDQDTSGTLVIEDHDRLDGADGIAMFTILKRNVIPSEHSYRLIFEKRYEGGADDPNRAYVFEFGGGPKFNQVHGNINRSINFYNDTAITSPSVPFILGSNYSQSRLPESLIFMYTNGDYSPRGTPKFFNFDEDINKSPAPVVIGRTGRFDMSEVITFRGGLTLTEAYAVSAYLGAKYGVALMDRPFFNNNVWKKDLLHLGVVYAERIRGNPSATTRGLTLVGDPAVMQVSFSNPAPKDQHVFVAHKGDALSKGGEWNRTYYVTNENGFSFDMYFDFEDAGLAINNNDTAQASGYKLYFADASDSTPVFDSIIDGSATKVDSTLKFEVNDPLKGWLKISKTEPTDTIMHKGLIDDMRLNADVNNPTCYGADDGAITISVDGGRAPYYYAWSNAAGNTASNTELVAGHYTVTVTDGVGNAVSQEFILEDAEEILLTATTEFVNCNGPNTGSIDFSVDNGVAPIDFLWSTGDKTEDLSGLSVGEYFVTVTDDRGCKSYTSYMINELPELVIDAQVTNIGCHENTQGSIVLDVEGGVSPYNYSWSNGGSSKEINGLSPADYRVTVSDANGCEKADTFQIYNAETVVADAGDDQDICPGELISLNATGGGTYLWSTGETTAHISVAPESDQSYIVEVEGDGCRDKDTVNIWVDPDKCLNVTVATNTADCGNANGSAMVGVSGGSSPYQIFWSTGDTVNPLKNLKAGQYGVQVVDAEGNVAYKSFSINNGSFAPDVDVIKDNVTCFGGSDGQIELNVTNGFPPYSYEWSNGSLSSSLSNLEAGSYNVKVEDSQGCQTSEEVFINEPEEMVINATKSQPLCNADDGEISINVTGGNDFFSYNWSNGYTGPTISNLSVGVYQVTASDHMGCEAVKTINLNGIDGPDISVSEIGNATCGLSDGYIDVNVSGGTEPYQYYWSNGMNGEGVQNLAQGTYELTVIDQNGCHGFADMQVELSSAAIPSICLVTTDTATGHNLIVWSPSPGLVSKYKVLKEVAYNDYQKIGEVSGGEYTMFVDSLSDPEVRSYKYRISAIDQCGQETPMSSPHKTIHLTSSVSIAENSVNLNWDAYAGYFYNQYSIYRYELSTGWNLIATIPGSPQDAYKSYTDQNVPDDVMKYFVAVDKGEECLASMMKASSGPFSQSISNLEDNRLTDPAVVDKILRDGGTVHIYPNPFLDRLNVKFKLSEVNDVTIELLDVLGSVLIDDLLKGVDAGWHEHVLSTQNLIPGVYYLRLTMGETCIVKSLVKE